MVMDSYQKIDSLCHPVVQHSHAELVGQSSLLVQQDGR